MRKKLVLAICVLTFAMLTACSTAETEVVPSESSSDTTITETTDDASEEVSEEVPEEVS